MYTHCSLVLFTGTGTAEFTVVSGTKFSFFLKINDTITMRRYPALTARGVGLAETTKFSSYQDRTSDASVLQM